MFFRLKKSGLRSYLQIVENRWEDGVTCQHVSATVGRVDELASPERSPFCSPPERVFATK